MSVFRTTMPLHALSAAMFSLALSAGVHAGGFDLPTIVASHQGTSNANGAEANDPSVIYYNPAGLTRLRGLQVSQGFSLLALRGNVEDMGSTGTPAPGQNIGRPLANAKFSDGDSGSFWPQVLGAGGLFVSMPINDMVTAGFGIFAPAGGNLNYKNDWSGAYQIDSIGLELININPSIGIRFDDKHSIGFGASIIGGHLKQKVQIDAAGVAPYLFAPVINDFNLNTPTLAAPIESLIDDLCGLTSFVGICSNSATGSQGLLTGAILTPEQQLALASGLTPLIVDPESRGSGTVEMYGYGFGYNLGYMYNFSDKTRMGIAYRGESKIKFRGDLEWDIKDIRASTNVGGIPLNVGEIIVGGLNENGNQSLENFLQKNLRPDTTAKGNFYLPARLSVNFFHELTEKIDLLLDYTFIETSIIDEIRVSFTDQRNPEGGRIKQGDGAVFTQWNNSYKVSLGANYHYDDKLTLRTGFQFDKTPVSSPEFRHPGLPDSDRYMYSLGANYKVKSNFSVDAAYSIVFLEDSLSNYRDPCLGVSDENDPSISCTGNGGTFRGKFSDTYIQILSVQLNQKF